MRRLTLAALIVTSLIGSITAAILGKRNFPDGMQGTAGSLPKPSVDEDENVREIEPTGPTYTDGVFTGKPVENEYGTVQVQITVETGLITQSAALQQPDSSPAAQESSALAIPQLNQNTVNAQSADIAGVVGATMTSLSYRDSLQNALDQAAEASTTGEESGTVPDDEGPVPDDEGTVPQGESPAETVPEPAP